MTSPIVAAFYWFVYLLAVLAGVLIGSLISAIWLRLAVQWLGFKPIPYLASFKSALISNFSLLMFNLGVGFSQGVLALMRSGGPGQSTDPRALLSMYEPTYFLWTAVFGLVMTAAIFTRTIPVAPNESPLTFPQCLAIAVFYQALSLAIMVLLFLIALLICTSWVITY
jgi:hypothetical protein